MTAISWAMFCLLFSYQYRAVKDQSIVSQFKRRFLIYIPN